MHTDTITDPIDELIPPPRPWWVRLVVGVAIVLVVGVVAALWGYGYLYPQPECCGSGDGSTVMTLTPDGNAVNVAAFFFNSSGRDLRIGSASADLPGATVLGIELLDEQSSVFTTSRTTPLPAVIDGTTLRHLVITFVPTSCQDDGRPWGKVSLRLDVVNDWLPSIDRTYMLPNAVVDTDRDDLLVFPPEGVDDTMLTTPLATACALLGRSDG